MEERLKSSLNNMKLIPTSLSLFLMINLGLSAEQETKDKLPSAKSDVVMPILKKFKPHMKFQDLIKILGDDYTDIGSGIYVLAYKLDDGSSITVGTVAKKEVLYIDHFVGLNFKKTRIYDSSLKKQNVLDSKRLE